MGRVVRPRISIGFNDAGRMRAGNQHVTVLQVRGICGIAGVVDASKPRSAEPLDGASCQHRFPPEWIALSGVPAVILNIPSEDEQSCSKAR